MMTATRARLVELVYSGDKQAVQEAIDKKEYDINEQTYTGLIAVHAAVERNDYEMLKLLIDSGAAVDIKSDSGKTPLSLAKARAKDDKKYFNTEIVKLIEGTLSANAASSTSTVKVSQASQDKTSNKRAITQYGFFSGGIIVQSSNVVLRNVRVNGVLLNTAVETYAKEDNEEQSTSAKRSKRETTKSSHSSQ